METILNCLGRPRVVTRVLKGSRGKQTDLKVGLQVLWRWKVHVTRNMRVMVDS